MSMNVRREPTESPVAADPVIAQPVGVLVPVNVGMPKDVLWRGKAVFTAVFKDPVSGPQRVREAQCRRRRSRRSGPREVR